MLLACERCHRQYDVGSHPEGSKVRCLCGQLCTVPKARSRQVEMLHCSNCGGKLAHGSWRCEYCSAEARLADRGLGPACPECFATTIAGAKHCGACGVKLETQGVLRALSSRACPRCKHALSECESAEARWIECTACGGLWLDEALFERVTHARDGALAAEFARSKAPVPPGASLENPVRYLPCPVCAQVMHRRNFASSSGIVIDWCREHGWWFDAHELERVLRFVEQGGLEKERARQHEDRKRELERREKNAPREAGPFADVERRPNLLDRLVDILTSAL